AEFGIAAHAFYKDGVGSPTELLKRESNAFAWLRRTVGILSESANPEEFLEHTKLELFHDQVFCFTPKGKLIALPRHANVIDFAYAVHTDVGNRDRKSTRLNSSHSQISYAVFCLKKKKIKIYERTHQQKNGDRIHARNAYNNW